MQFASMGWDQQMGVSSKGAFLPSDLTGLKAWFRFNSGITVTGAGVSQWDDASGEGNHLLQGTDTNRPSKEVDGSILFDGVDNYLKTDAFTRNQPDTMYLLLKAVTWTSGRYITDGFTVNRPTIRQINSTPEIQLTDHATATTNLDLTLGTYFVISSVLGNGSSSFLRLDNDTPVTATLNTNSLGGLTLASHGAVGAHSNIQVKEIVIYDSAHDAATRTKVINYLSSL